MATSPVIISAGGDVRERETGRPLGSVNRVSYPISDGSGGVRVHDGWEARGVGEALVYSPYSFGFFGTRMAAAMSLLGR